MTRELRQKFEYTAIQLHLTTPIIGPEISLVRFINLEVIYEPGATPFEGNIASGPLAGRSWWSITEDNLKALFASRTKIPTINVPETISEMQEIPAQNQASWTTQKLTELAAQYQKNPQTDCSGDQATILVAFLKGNLERDSKPDSGIVGVSVGGTSVIAIFKEVVQSTGINPAGIVPRFVEQSTLIHEAGHALGLVNNGVSLASNHQDTANGSHCTNTSCVMYWLNEGRESAKEVAQTLSESNSAVIFGAECLKDTQEFAP